MNDNKRVLICGVGRMGEAISWCMDTFGYHVIGIDNNMEASRRLGLEFTSNFGKKPTDFLLVENESDIKKAIELTKPSIAISSLPYHQTMQAAFTCIDLGIPYCDLGGRVDVSHRINTYANDHAKKPVITDLGLAPGWVNILAEEACSALEEEVVDVKTMVGGLPVQMHNPPFNYTVTWSVDGLINEYKDKCEIVCCGRRDIVRGMDGLENVYCRSIDKELEAFYTRGGASHSITSMLERGVENFSYRTLRYKGHNQLIKTLLNSNTKVDEECLKEVFSKVCSPKGTLGIEDQVIIKCIATGKSGKTWDKEFLVPSTEGRLTAMQKATSFGISCVAKQILEEDIKGGKLGYRDVNYKKFNENLEILRKELVDPAYEIQNKQI